MTTAEYREQAPLSTAILTTELGAPITCALPITSAELVDKINQNGPREAFGRLYLGRHHNPILEEGTGFEGHIIDRPADEAVYTIADWGVQGIDSVLRDAPDRYQLRKFIEDPAHPITDPRLLAALYGEMGALLARFRAMRSMTSNPELTGAYQDYVASTVGANVDAFSFKPNVNGTTVSLGFSRPGVNTLTRHMAPPVPFGTKKEAEEAIGKLSQSRLQGYRFMHEIGRLGYPPLHDIMGQPFFYNDLRAGSGRSFYERAI